eukprot:SM000055S18313  [mRNA]  locus=s55:615811:620704:- [translate_table: standard]
MAAAAAAMAAAAAATADDVARELRAGGFEAEDDDTAAACVSLCTVLGVGPRKLAASWEVFYLNRQLNGDKVLAAQIPGFRNYLQDELAAERKKAIGVHFYTKDDIDSLVDELAKQPEAANDSQPSATPSGPATGAGSPGSGTPGVAPRTPSASAEKEPGPATPFTPFGSRSNRGAVIASYNEGVTFEAPSHQPVARSRVELLGQRLSPDARYMRYTTEERQFNSEARKIERFSAVLASCGLLDPAQQNMYASQDPVTVVGRVCCDAEGARLNNNPLPPLLGARVRLDLQNIPQYSLFPGQAKTDHRREGKKPGHCLVANEVMDTLPLPPLPTPARSTDRVHHNGKRLKGDDDPKPSTSSMDSLKVIVAAGPYTTSDNLLYEPLEELLDYALEQRPNLLILVLTFTSLSRPFVDSEHPGVKTGNLEVTFKRLFQQQICTRVLNVPTYDHFNTIRIAMQVEQWCKAVGSKCQVVLVPSVRDAHHTFLYPQPPFHARDFEDPDRQVYCASNPGLLSCNDVVIGCNSMDILKHLSSEEASNSGSDRMTRLASHMIRQRSFYPLFPPALGVPLDPTLQRAAALDLPVLPDLLLLLSDLAAFVKELPRQSEPSPILHTAGEEASQSATAMEVHQEGGECNSKDHQVLCINPGRVAKGNSGGTLALVQVAVGGGHMHQRCRVDLLKL